MIDTKLLIMEVIQNDCARKPRFENKNNTNKQSKDSFSFRESYESHFMFWRKSFIHEGTSGSFQSDNSQRQREKSV